MPTTLPVRTALPARPHDLIAFARTTCSFYVGVAISIAIMMAIEHHLGMFKGPTLAESALTTISTGWPYSDPQLIGMF